MYFIDQERLFQFIFCSFRDLYLSKTSNICQILNNIVLLELRNYSNLFMYLSYQEIYRICFMTLFDD